MTQTPPQAPQTEDAQAELMTRERWLQRLGFQFNPFEYEAADELEGGDPHLDQYFVPFPYFEELKRARSSILFTQRGCGKSANCLRLEQWCEETLEKPDTKFLAVRYDDFWSILADISLESHVQAILRRAVPALLEKVFRYFPDALDNLSRAKREDLSWFVQNYSDRLIPATLRRQLREIGAARADAPRLTRGVIQAVAALFKKQPLEAIERATETLIELFQREFQETEVANRLGSEPLELMRRFAAIVRELNFAHLLVLIDRVDELQGPAGQPERQVELLRPLLANVPARGIWPFKLFLPHSLLPVLRRTLGPDEFREDKTQILEVEWQPQEIARLLQTRLSSGSQDRHSSFVTLVQDGPTDIDDQLVEFAHHSPRDLIRLCNHIFTEHTRLPTNKLYLETDEIQAAKRWFSKTRARELYGDDWLAQLIRLPAMPFTAADVSQALKLNPEETGVLLQDWQKKGLVKSQRRDPARPEAALLFDIADPRARLVWEEEHL